MMTLDEIREDLKDIRYYYGRRFVFDLAIDGGVFHYVRDKVEKYNNAIREAPPRLYDLYIGLYIKNNTQEAVASELGYTTEYVQMQNKKLLLFLQSYFDKKIPT